MPWSKGHSSRTHPGSGLCQDLHIRAPETPRSPSRAINTPLGRFPSMDEIKNPKGRVGGDPGPPSSTTSSRRSLVPLEGKPLAPSLATNTQKNDERLLFHPFPQHSDTVKAIPQLVRMKNSGVGDPKAVVSPTKPGGQMPESIQPGWEHKAHL